MHSHIVLMRTRFFFSLQVPVPLIRTLVDSFVQDVRFSCHNLFSQHCWWALFWFVCSSVLWTGVVGLAVSRQHSYGLGIGAIMLLCYLIPLFCHLISCFICRLWVTMIFIMRNMSSVFRTRHTQDTERNIYLY